MKPSGKCRAEGRRKKPQRQGLSALEEAGGSPEVDALGDMASEYASEIQRSPFARPFGHAAGGPMPLVSLSSLLSPAADFDGWYPSHLLPDDTLRQPPDSSARIPLGMLSGIVDSRARQRIERQHRAALAAAFRAALDAEPAFRRLCAIESFRMVLNAFATARDKSKPASPLRQPQAEAQLIMCLTRPLWRLRAKDWRPAPTEKAITDARKAVLALIAAAKDGLHSLPSYYPAVGALRTLLRELDAPTGRARAPRLDDYTARNVTREYFERLLAGAFGADAFETDLKGARLAYAAMLDFRNPSDKVSP